MATTFFEILFPFSLIKLSALQASSAQTAHKQVTKKIDSITIRFITNSFLPESDRGLDLYWVFLFFLFFSFSLSFLSLPLFLFLYFFSQILVLFLSILKWDFVVFSISMIFFFFLLLLFYFFAFLLFHLLSSAFFVSLRFLPLPFSLFLFQRPQLTWNLDPF